MGTGRKSILLLLSMILQNILVLDYLESKCLSNAYLLKKIKKKKNRLCMSYFCFVTVSTTQCLKSEL